MKPFHFYNLSSLSLIINTHCVILQDKFVSKPGIANKIFGCNNLICCLTVRPLKKKEDDHEIYTLFAPHCPDISRLPG